MRIHLSSRRTLGAGLTGGLALAAALAFSVSSCGSSTAPASAEPTASASPTASPSPSPTDTPTPTPTVALPPLPDMLAAIGDSYTRAYDVAAVFSPHHDHPAYSWAVGTAKKDGIFSLRERFEAAGAELTVVDASTSGRKMSDAVRQANVVVAAARKLPAGETAYVTFELGTNDLCAEPNQPITKPATFDAQLRSAMTILADGLPPGSRILMMSVPDFVRFRVITQADPAARAHFNQNLKANSCPPFLGASNTTTIPQATAILAQYDDSLRRACADIEAGGRVHCTSNIAGLAEADFTIEDLSPADYFHPSITGQAKMAQAAWTYGDWSVLELPPGAAY
jgi:lysophospholipase L1-like esterase